MIVAASGCSRLLIASCNDCPPPKHQPKDTTFSGLTLGSEERYFTADLRLAVASVDCLLLTGLTLMNDYFQW